MNTLLFSLVVTFGLTYQALIAAAPPSNDGANAVANHFDVNEFVNKIKNFQPNEFENFVKNVNATIHKHDQILNKSIVNDVHSLIETIRTETAKGPTNANFSQVANQTQSVVLKIVEDFTAKARQHNLSDLFKNINDSFSKGPATENKNN